MGEITIVFSPTTFSESPAVHRPYSLPLYLLYPLVPGWKHS